MPQVSKRYIDKETYEKIFSLFLKSLRLLKNKKHASGFADDFFTKTEKKMFAKRITIAFLLAKNYNYREISDILKVSTSTIRTVKNSLFGSSEYQYLITDIIERENVDKILLSLGIKVAEVLSMGGSKSAPWRSVKRQMEAKKRKKM